MKITGVFSMRKPDRSFINASFSAELEKIGTVEEIAEMLLEAEMYGNSKGTVRVHLFLEDK